MTIMFSINLALNNRRLNYNDHANALVAYYFYTIIVSQSLKEGVRGRLRHVIE